MSPFSLIPGRLPAAGGVPPGGAAGGSRQPRGVGLRCARPGNPASRGEGPVWSCPGGGGRYSVPLECGVTTNDAFVPPNPAGVEQRFGTGSCRMGFHRRGQGGWVGLGGRQWLGAPCGTALAQHQSPVSDLSRKSLSGMQNPQSWTPLTPVAFGEQRRKKLEE